LRHDELAAEQSSLLDGAFGSAEEHLAYTKIRPSLHVFTNRSVETCTRLRTLADNPSNSRHVVIVGALARTPTQRVGVTYPSISFTG